MGNEGGGGVEGNLGGSLSVRGDVVVMLGGGRE
jgi:hypothetical protein